MAQRRFGSKVAVAVLLSGFGGYIGFAARNLYRSINKDPTLPPVREISKQVSYEISPDHSENYDERVNSAERFLGISSKRIKLASIAKGTVLETAAGTNRNIDGYAYNKKIEKIIFVDKNRDLLEKGCEKARIKVLAGYPLPRMEFHVGNMTKLDYPSDSFDTVINTFGLCSCPDPQAALGEIKRCVKPDGRILLLQHGLGSWSFLNELLHKFSHDHAKTWGCWWNRDIHALVREADLDIVISREYIFSTIKFIVAKKKPQDDLAQLKNKHYTESC